LNVTQAKKISLDPEFRQELQDFYQQDIEKLADIVDRDLSEWR
jgi:hypothetical protein